MSSLHLHFTPIISEDRSTSADEVKLCQPFLREDGEAYWLLRLTREFGTWEQAMNPEETAFALSQVTAAHILPLLTALPCGSDLLEYRVNLRDHLDGSLVDELALILQNAPSETGWERVSHSSYLSVIGAGVAACIDISPNQEVLYLRYATDLEHALFLAGRTLDLPRSRLFLQSALFEKVDMLLAQVRGSTWNWLIP